MGPGHSPGKLWKYLDSFLSKGKLRNGKLFAKMSSLYQIEKLDNGNNDSWCVQMRSVFVHSGYWKIVNDSFKRESAANDKAKEAWDENDERALASITLNNLLKRNMVCATSLETYNLWLNVLKKASPQFYYNQQYKFIYIDVRS